MRAVLLLLPAVVACAPGSAAPTAADLPAVVTWNDHVGYLMEDVCVACHGRTHRIEGYDFTAYDAVVCAWDDIQEQLAGNHHPPGGAPRFDGWELAVLDKWAAEGFAVEVDAAGEPLFPVQLVCRGGGDD